MKILFVSDYVCPYCLVAKEAMGEALRELNLDPEITWHPFELTVEPKPRVDTYHDEERKAHYQVLKEPCRELGLDMKLPPFVVPRPYTRLAFEGYFYALEQGKGESYNDLMYKAYFVEEQDIGDPEVLCRLAKAAGLDEEAYQKALETGVYSDKLKEANRHAREDLQVSHVPTIYVDGTEVTVEKYTKDEFLALFQEYLKKETPEDEAPAALETILPEEAADGNLDGDGGDEPETSVHAGGCGPTGCSIF